MNTAWCGVERGSASSTSPPVTAPAARDHVAVPRATAAPGSRLDRPLTLPPPSTKSEKSQLFRLWRALHSRNYAQSPDMRSRLAAETGVGPFSAGERCALA